MSRWLLLACMAVHAAHASVAGDHAQVIPLLWTEYFTWNIALRMVLIVVVGWAAHRWIAVPAQVWLDPRRRR